MARVLFLLLLAISFSAEAQNRWTKLAPFPEPAEELLGASANEELEKTIAEASSAHLIEDSFTLSVRR